ncbi:cyclin-L2-like [Chanos chanos]|uniref:Cyclin-L2-like n=1 Tax=Chanos chanos TaxID=29144 RepID=A0A6J2VQD0_CHACN|nr:cyclin-L2 [Chanos chanos]
MSAGDLRIPGEGILIGDKLYSAVLLTLENCILPLERLLRSPSSEHGLPSDTEEQLRIRGCEMIQAAGILLRLPQVAMATGQILFQRFFYCKSFVRHCAESVAMACVHLASKIEEEPRRVRDVLNVFHYLKHSEGDRKPGPMPLDASYINLKSQVIKAERRVLKELGFCVHVKHPHKIIVMYLQVLECEKNTKLVQMSWNYMNDSLRTDVFLRYKAETVACACIYLSARSLQIPLPDQPPWFLLFGATEEELRDISGRILRLYTLPSVPLSTLLRQVEVCRQALEAQSAKAKRGGGSLLAVGTPTLDPPSSFSPGSKAASPAGAQQNRESTVSEIALKNVCRKLANGERRIRLSRSDERREPVGMGLRLYVSPAQTAFYIIFVMLGIIGNAVVVSVVGEGVIREPGGGRSSDMILVNMAFSNLMVSVMRNSLLIISDLGLELYSSKGWCQFLMGVWVWLRSVNVWSTFFLSAFHFQTLRRVAPPVVNLHGPRGPPRSLLAGFALIWIVNLMYSIPAFIFSTSGDQNTTETLMLVSSTTRPLLGCIWNFATPNSGLIYATTSMVIHETLPILLMCISNMGSLLTLYSHARLRKPEHMSQDAPIIRRVPAERRAAKVILALVMLFITSWGTSIISVNYFNYNRGSSTEFLLVISRFANITFIALSPIVLAVGHRRLRSVIKSVLSH